MKVRSLRRRSTHGVIVVLLFASVGSAEMGRGPKIGAYVPTFFIRTVTGPLRNKSVCYVCRNGQRPVVMELLRETPGEVTTLLRGIDRLVDRNRARGIRSFGVFLSEEPAREISRVQTLAFESKITTPLGVASESVGGPGGQNVDPDAAVTVVFYQRRKVTSQFTFRSGELTATETNAVLTKLRAFIEAQ